MNENPNTFLTVELTPDLAAWVMAETARLNVEAIETEAGQDYQLTMEQAAAHIIRRAFHEAKDGRHE